MRTLTDLAADLGTGALTARALVETCLARIEDPVGQGAKTFLRVYRDQALASADAMDALRRVNRAPSPYAGIPVSLKDLIDVAGEPTPAASLIRAAAPAATAHAVIVQRLLGAGFIPIGRTNMTEFAFSGLGLNPHFGTPLCPFDRATGRIPGGSSSGAAVSVSDGMAPVAIGTDTGGSCRIPAAFCAVTGFKPTARRVPLTGIFPLAPTLDSAGPLGASVACCAIADAILAGEPAVPPPALPAAGLRLLIPQNYVLENMDAATERAFDRAIQRLHDQGALLARRRLSAYDILQEANSRGSYAAAEAYAVHRDMLAAHRARYDPRVADRIAPGADLPVANYIHISNARRAAQTMFAAEMTGQDALLLPTVPIAPPPLAAFTDEALYWRTNGLVLRNPATINFLDGCAISLPCHTTGEPPAGLMLAAPALADRHLLSVAAGVEMAIK